MKKIPHMVSIKLIFWRQQSGSGPSQEPQPHSRATPSVAGKKGNVSFYIRRSTFAVAVSGHLAGLARLRHETIEREFVPQGCDTGVVPEIGLQLGP